MDRARRLAVQELMIRLADGERAAVAPLFEALWPALRAVCRRALASDADGDDAAQEAMIKIVSRVADFDRSRDAVSWALAIAAWECRTVRRRAMRRREEALDPAAEPAGQAASAHELVAERELLAAAGEVLGSLGAGDIAVLRAAWSGDRAARPAVAPATFRKRLERALARLRAAWRSRHGEI